MAARAQYGKQRQALPQHRRLLRLQKSASKTTQNADICVKTAIVRVQPSKYHRIQAVQVEKHARVAV